MTELDERLTFAMRQAAFLAVALVVAGLVTNRLLPADAAERTIVSAPFLWAIVAWTVVLLINAIAFDTSQMATLERWPLAGALGVGAVLFLTGLVVFDAGTLAARIVYLFANSLGAVMFWWAIFAIVALLVQRLRTPAS